MHGPPGVRRPAWRGPDYSRWRPGDAEPDAKYTFTTTLDQSLRQDVSKYAPFPRVALNVTLDLTVATGGALHADGRGFGGGDLAEGPLSETSSVLNTSADIASNHRDLSTARGDGAGESAASGRRPHPAHGFACADCRAEQCPGVAAC